MKNFKRSANANADTEKEKFFLFLKQKKLISITVCQHENNFKNIKVTRIVGNFIFLKLNTIFQMMTKNMKKENYVIEIYDVKRLSSPTPFYISDSF